MKLKKEGVKGSQSGPLANTTSIWKKIKTFFEGSECSNCRYLIQGKNNPFDLGICVVKNKTTRRFYKCNDYEHS